MTRDPLHGLVTRSIVRRDSDQRPLQVVRNTHAGLTGIPGPLRESAEALGLSRGTILRRIELPLASPLIMAGIKTAVVINIGTATPAALLALGAQALFDALEHWVVPKGLRL